MMCLLWLLNGVVCDVQLQVTKPRRGGGSASAGAARKKPPARKKPTKKDSNAPKK